MSQVKVYKPTTASRRKSSVVNYAKVLTVSEPYKKLVEGIRKKAGRNNSGKITVRHRGSGVKRLLRKITTKHVFEQGFKVETIEYDPNRTAFVCLVVDIKTGTRHYVLHTSGMEVGGVYGHNTELFDGNRLALGKMPVGTLVSQIELQPGQGAKIVRSAGVYATVTARDGNYVTLKLPSGEIRKFLAACVGVVNKVGNESHGLVRIGKAGRVRHKGFRHTVRGKVMNPVDHPHGGGEARNSIGMKYPKTPTGKHAIGIRTRNKKKISSKLIIKRRAKKR